MEVTEATEEGFGVSGARRGLFRLQSCSYSLTFFRSAFQAGDLERSCYFGTEAGGTTSVSPSGVNSRSL
jgi:hypothetical protein